MRQTVKSWTSHLNIGEKVSEGILLLIFPCLLLLYHLLGICSFDLVLRSRSKQILLTVQSGSKPAYSLLIHCWSLRQWWLYFDAIMVSESCRPKGGGKYIYIYINFVRKSFFLENYQAYALFHFCIFKIKLLPWVVINEWVTSGELTVVQNEPSDWKTYRYKLYFNIYTQQFLNPYVSSPGFNVYTNQFLSFSIIT